MSEVPNRQVTSRGFQVYDTFTDLNQQEIVVNESSLATENAVRIYVGDFKPTVCAHLNLEQAMRVRNALTAWIEEHPEMDAR